MRTLALLVLVGAFWTPGCSSACCKEAAEGKAPPMGRVLTTCGEGGAIVVSMGTQDGVRPGSVLYITRGGSVVGTMIVHSANQNQAAGTPYGDATRSSIQPGDAVLAEQ